MNKKTTSIKYASMLDGQHVAIIIKNRIKQDMLTRQQQGLRPPGLAVILVGKDEASSIYVNAKRRACLDVGFESFVYHLSDETTEADLLSLIDKLNIANDVDGILVQLPLPKHINTDSVLERINPKKDVDGFHPLNFGRLAQGRPYLRPCTPYGIMTLLKYYQIPISGQHAVIVGASNIVGRPIAFELLAAKATVTICHRQTRDLEEAVRMANIIVVGTGIPGLIKTSWLNQNQIVIDVGIDRRADGSVRGEIDFDSAKHQVAWITPVPGGVGPMTIAILLENTLLAAQSSDP